MCSSPSLVSASFANFTLVLFLAEMASGTKSFNIAATGGVLNHSILQCWQLSAPLIASTQLGTQGPMVAQLGDLSHATYSILPAGTNGGAGVAPYSQ